MGCPPALTAQQRAEARKRRSEGATLKELAQSYNGGGIATIFPPVIEGAGCRTKGFPFVRLRLKEKVIGPGADPTIGRNRSSVLRSGRHYRPRRRQSTQATRPSLESTSRSPPSDLQRWQSRPYPILENSRPRPQSPHLYVALNEVANDLLLCGGAQSRPRDSDDSKTPLRSAGDVQGNFVANDGTQEGLSKWGRL
jgi:hypothetical protein